MRIIITSHAKNALRARMGAGPATAEKLARRAWDEGNYVPPEWKVPRPKEKFHNRRYGDFVFIYGPSKFEPGSKCLITVVGPFGNGKVWEKDENF